MKKKNIVKKSDVFTKIIKTAKPYRQQGYLIFLERSTVPDFQFGITVSNKVGNAVTRNRIKRQIKSIIDKNHYQNNFKCIIIIKREILEKSYDVLERELNEYFFKYKLLEDQHEEN